MKHITPLIDIIRTCLFTPYVKNERPVSILLIAKAESGKTEILSKVSFAEDQSLNKGILYISDFTAYGLINGYGAQLEKGTVKSIVCPEFLKITSRKDSSVKDTLAFLNALIEEGLVNSQTYNIKREFKKPVRCNFITAITTEVYGKKKRLFMDYGFLSRMIPIAYEYSPQTIDSIFEDIIGETHHTEKNETITFPDEPQVVTLPRKYSRKIKDSVLIIATKHNLHGFRLQKNLQCMMKAHALSHGRNEVVEEDYEAIVDLIEWVSFGESPRVI